ncbi:hypothetical protein EUX98_g5169 [Antrodiella citrinella]|uniref:Uncharacterized protein n=1 Tax=Antrodiella citrinella TaxID=2447956 RepID=A0A4S4MS79_9APHY|nr:hypothetical protein EUX98_g5169 [Antrodiella citrinella]
MPPSEDDESLPSAAPPPTGQLFQPYPAFRPHEDFLYLTPAPRSPHASLSTLPDLYMDDVFEAPSSPHSPHSSLPEAFDEDTYPPPLDTISPSLLSHASETPNEGLGLFIQADPPLRRSPSPDDDLLQFIDIQLDPETSNLDVSEFIALRDLRKCALDAEREARNREASLNDRVTAAATALLPSTLVDDDIVNDLSEKRLRKHELHVAMDLRNVARQDRKREKQKIKEIGALLDVKMNGEYPAPFGVEPLGGMSQLVASMVMRRRETARSLANRKSAGQRPYINSSLSFSVSSEDLHQADVDMGTE